MANDPEPKEGHGRNRPSPPTFPQLGPQLWSCDERLGTLANTSAARSEDLELFPTGSGPVAKSPAAPITKIFEAGSNAPELGPEEENLRPLSSPPVWAGRRRIVRDEARPRPCKVTSKSTSSEFAFCPEDTPLRPRMSVILMLEACRTCRMRS